MGSHPDWVLGFQDEVWWSRLARPALHARAAGEPVRLHELAADKDDPAPTFALGLGLDPACCGPTRGG